METNIQLTQFHNGKIRECIIKNEDDSYTIFIESTLSRQEQIKAYYHAVNHILDNDFDKSTANLIEKEAHISYDYREEE